MNDLIEKRNIIIRKLQDINDKVTEDVLKDATKEEMEEYIELINSITTKLEKLNRMIEENK